MTSTSNGRGEISWRKELLKRHTLKAVVKLSEDLFLPNAHKGTYGVVIEAHKPHGNKKVFWGIMDDGFSMKKSKRIPDYNLPSNYDLMSDKLQKWLIRSEEPEQIQKIISCNEIDFTDETLDCGVEAYLEDTINKNINLSSITSNLFTALVRQRESQIIDFKKGNYISTPVQEIIEKIFRGDCKPIKNTRVGKVPVVTTTEVNNGIAGYYNITDATVFEDAITIPANGSKYKAFYHPYKFVAVPDILVMKVKPEYDSFETKLFICAMINQSSWRFSYFRKCNELKIKKDVKIVFPIKNDRKIDKDSIIKSVAGTVEYAWIKQLMNRKIY